MRGALQAHEALVIVETGHELFCDDASRRVRPTSQAVQEEQNERADLYTLNITLRLMRIATNL